MAQKESKRSRDIMNALRVEGWFCFKVHGTELVMAGLPDIIVCAEGLFVGLETKEPDKRDNTSARQDYIHDRIREAGGVVHVVVTPAEAVSVVRRALELRSC
jgi:hypothetical protein